MPNFIGWDDKRLERYFNALYNGDFNAQNLPPDLYEAILDRLTEAVVKGFGISEPGTQKAKIFVGLVDNLAVFSAAKTYQQINDMQNFLFDSTGNKRPFSVFKEAAAEIFETYNDNWLKTEYNTAIGQSQSAADWADIEEQSEALPWLRYETVGDGRVRPDHQDLDGIVKRVNDPFWDVNAPLNGFGCRCRLVQLEEGEETDLDALEKKLGRPIEQPDDLFKFNPGKKRVIFDETKHPYLKVDQRYRIASKPDGTPIKQPPRVPKPVKKELAPKVVPSTVAPAVFKTKKAARDFITRSIEANSAIKVKNVAVSSKLSIEQTTKRIAALDSLFKEYDIADATASDYDTTKIIFKSNRTYLGVVRSGYYRPTGTRFIKEINLGDDSSRGTSNLYVKGDTKTRFNSRVDPENLDVATLTHEFAHVISVDRVKRMDKATDRDKGFLYKLSSLQTDYYGELNALKNDPVAFYEMHLGQYASSNVNEFMAEGFAEYKLSKNPSKYAVKIGQLIDEFYKK